MIAQSSYASTLTSAITATPLIQSLLLVLKKGQILPVTNQLIVVRLAVFA